MLVFDKFNCLVHLGLIVAGQTFDFLVKLLGQVQRFFALSWVDCLHLIDNRHKLQLNEIYGLLS